MWNVIGQDEAISLFTEGIKKNSLSHASLFTGPPHTGKMTLALELAKAVNCTAEDIPCGQCNLTTGVELGEKPKMKIGIEVFRGSEDTDKRDGIIKQVSLPPFEGKYRVYIIEDAETLSEEAANCFLKTLEEPLGRVLFILLVTDERRLPATVVSRCQHIKVKPLPLAKIESLLTEKYDVPPENAKLVSHLSHGAAGWAITAAGDEMILEDYAENMSKIIGFLTSGYEERFAYAAALAAQFAKRNGLTEEFLDNLLDFWRDLLLVKIGATDMITNINMLLELQKDTNNFTVGELRKFIGDIRAARRQLELNASPRLVLEVLMLNMPQMGKTAAARS
jgi:DNA polymerase-3 subunit delta'